LVSNTDLFYQAAMELGFPCKPDVPKTHTMRIDLGKQCFLFSVGYSPFNCASAAEYASHKFFANRALERAGLPVPRVMLVARDHYNKHGISLGDLSFPVVIKPNRNIYGGGRGVVCNIQNQEVLIQAMSELFKQVDSLTIEEFHANYNAYRVLVFYNQVIGVVERTPAQIVGDGVHTIEMLIQQQNVIRKLQAEYVTMGPIAMDAELNIRLNELGLKLDSIPGRCEVVRLCYGCNSTRGGTMRSLGRAICKENERLICSAAGALHLNLVGFDVLCKDIMVPIRQSGGVIIEANVNPDITIHESPLSGQPMAVSKTIVKKLAKQHPVLYRLYRKDQCLSVGRHLINFKRVLAVVLLAYILPQVHLFNDHGRSYHATAKEYHHETHIM
jgi:D-alanine-D-alanine ligase-like ATP-grasp enzyme